MLACRANFLTPFKRSLHAHFCPVHHALLRHILNSVLKTGLAAPRGQCARWKAKPWRVTPSADVHVVHARRNLALSWRRRASFKRRPRRQLRRVVWEKRKSKKKRKKKKKRQEKRRGEESRPENRREVKGREMDEISKDDGFLPQPRRRRHFNV